MTHELKQIVEAHKNGKAKGLKSVLATVVALDGSSYRRPGVRMLILEDGHMVGAVSGGCVEKEILRQADAVFTSGIAKVMTYDGRYRLGCEGILYILLEPFSPDADFLKGFEAAVLARTDIGCTTYYRKEQGQQQQYGSAFVFQNTVHHAHALVSDHSDFLSFHQTMPPCMKLMIIGAEHDAVQLCDLASRLGWEVGIIAHPTEEKKLADFPGAISLEGILGEHWNTAHIDSQTAVILMTHSYVKDLQFLIALADAKPCYLGLLGPNKRREKLLNEFLEHCPEIDDTFFDHVYGPAGLNIGSETPQEIAVAILAEILAVIRGKAPMSLRDKQGGIHA